MSAHHLRALMQVRVNEFLNGDPNAETPSVGVNQRLLGEAALPKDYAEYTRLVGWRRGMVDAMRLLDECFAQMHEQPPEGT